MFDPVCGWASYGHELMGGNALSDNEFYRQAWDKTFDDASENARCIWLAGEVPCVWICDAENNMVKRIKLTLDLQ